MTEQNVNAIWEWIKNVNWIPSAIIGMKAPEMNQVFLKQTSLGRSLLDNKATLKQTSCKLRRESIASGSALLVVPAGIEPASSESESEILSIVLRNQL